MRLSTRSLMAWASMARSFSQVNAAHSGFCPVSSVFRYETRYFGIRSSSSLHQVDEAREEIVGIVRPRRGLGVVLDGEDGQLAVAHPLGRPVVEVGVRLDEPGLLHRLRVHGEAVVLRGDLDAPGQEVLHRVVRAVVAELELEGLSSEGQTEDLVAEADAENRRLADETAHRFDQVRHGLRIA